MNGYRQSMVLQALEKAVHSGNISAIVPEDLEVEAYSTLWNETTPGQLTLLKLLPSVPATSIAHEYSLVTSYGESRMSGFFGERSLPPETNFTSERVINSIKLMGEVGPTFLLAALEKTQKALGTTGAENIERVALRLNVLWKKNRNLYFADTSKTRLGVAGVRFKGLRQLIREGTDGTVGTSPFGTHEIDMLGAPITVDTLRDRVAKAMNLFGSLRELVMDPFARGDLEASMDNSQRLNLPIGARAYMIGQNIGGFQTNGSVVFFETDNSLSPLWAFGQYKTTDLPEGMPVTTPTLAVAVGAPGGARVSYWDAASAGNIFWMITETVDELEGLGTRIPAGAAFQAVAAGQEVTLTITPGNPLADSFKVYRGSDADAANTDAWFIYEVANSGGGAAVTSYDDNEYRPNTSVAFGMNIVSDSERSLHDGSVDAYAKTVARSSDFLNQPDGPRNTISVAELGPRMGVMNLASVLAQVSRPLLYSACSPEVRIPRQNLVLRNIGRA